MGIFDNAIFYLDSLGLTQVILPFVLIFTVLFAIMQKVKIFGDLDKTKKFNVIIALVIALGVVIPHITGGYPPDQDPINIINGILPGSALILIVLTIVFITLALIIPQDK
ncbi:MAG: hypothetical protein AABY13_03035, partial [Nanoarchaeota archaeon]